MSAPNVNAMYPVAVMSSHSEPKMSSLSVA